MKRIVFYIVLATVTGCTLPEEKKIKAEEKARVEEKQTVMESMDSNAALKLPAAPSLPLPPKTREPQGIFQVMIPMKGQLEHTVLFRDNYSFKLQERYFGRPQGDSVVTIEGNWNPSDGFIWLYKDQVVRARYKWKNDTLQYLNPESKKSFSMHHLDDILTNAAWKNKENSGVMLYAIGTEPFWNVEVFNKDSISFFLADWTSPLQMRLQTLKRTKDSTVYLAKNDSVQLKLVVLPFFCSDGMSDYVYSNEVRVNYNGLKYRGCGKVYQP